MAESSTLAPRWAPRTNIDRTREIIIQVLLALTLLTIIVPVVVIVGYLLWNGRESLLTWAGKWPTNLNWAFLTEAPRRGLRAGGIAPAITGTLYLVGLTIALAVPTGVLTAVYLNEYATDVVALPATTPTSFRGWCRLRWRLAKPWITRAIRLAILNLAGVPSVVYGLFGVGLFVYFLKFGTSLLAGACTMAILVLPMVITASEEALKTIPTSFREASLALGVSKWQTIWRIVLPNALPGILTGVILSIGRAAGETAPLLFTCMAYTVGAGGFALPHLKEPIMALPGLLFTASITGAPARVQYGTAVVLLVVVLGMNIAAILLRARLRRGKRW
jgi:phosphate transport system permease protein